MDIISLLLLLTAIIMFVIAGFFAHRFTSPVPSWGWIGALCLALMLLVERVWA